MIVDSSALLAVVFSEPEEDRFAQAIIDARDVRMSAVNWAESAIVVDGRKNPEVVKKFERLLEVFRIEIIPVTAEMASRARAAYREFGRGNHRARLNFADTFAYALAKIVGEPLLFKGNDFSRTDIEPALKA